ncbi:MAG: hypothetical protein LBT69_00785 [Lactobacillales bacterium]|jgi:hypothetical protein|nr:hypothetical protein [Lactobacillales bacterium]
MKRIIQMLLCLEIILCALTSSLLGREIAEFQALHQESIQGSIHFEKEPQVKSANTETID